MQNVVIADGMRTPFGLLGGGLRQFHNVEMQCGSGIAALNHTAYRIMMGDPDMLLVGGVQKTCA